MDKEELIYDVVCEIRDQNNKRFEVIEKDVRELKDCKNRALGFIGCISLCGAFLGDYIKNLFR